MHIVETIGSVEELKEFVKKNEEALNEQNETNQES